MVDLATILAGFSDAFTLWNLAFVIFGVALGQLVARRHVREAPRAFARRVVFQEHSF